MRENGKPIYRDVNGDRVDGTRTTSSTSRTCTWTRTATATSTRTTAALPRPGAEVDPRPLVLPGLRHFDSSFTLRSYLGNYVYNNVASNLGTYSEVTRGSPYNLHASVLETGFETPQYLSDYYVEDASFLRMDNMTLGYTVQLSRASRPGSSARCRTPSPSPATAGWIRRTSPGQLLNGIDNNIYPRSRTFTGGLSLRF